MMYSFNAVVEIIVGNPFVFVPENILHALFQDAGKTRGPIPVCGKLNDKEYTQTLVKYSGAWRLYVNMQMLKNSPSRIGETVHIEIGYDPRDRTEPLPARLKDALAANEEAHKVFLSLPPSRQKEIKRYINQLKSESTVERNVQRAINFLLGKERFVGRDKP